MISAGDLQQARARARIRNVRVAPRSICRRESGTALVHNKPPLFPPYFLFLFSFFFFFFFFCLLSSSSRICGHRVRKSSSAIFCKSYSRSARSRAPCIESHRLGKSSSVIFYNVCTYCTRVHAQATLSLPPSLSPSRSLFLGLFFFSPSLCRCIPKGLEWRYYARAGSRLLIPRYTGRRMIL
jgi:hypothetical protein